LKNENLKSLIACAGEDYGINLSTDQVARSISYILLLRRWNRRISLTSVRDDAELVRYHLFEGFLAEKKLPFPVKRIADIGSGAGFPGIPMHIMNPCRETLLIEKNLKKATFLSAVLRELSLPGQVINTFSEQTDVWGRIDLATVRALKLSDQTLDDLFGAGVHLLILEGETSQLSGKPWKIILEEECPFSDNRIIRIFQPDVSRETIRKE